MNPLAATLGPGQVATLFLVLLRCTGFVVTAPILGHRAVPGPVKAGLIAVLAVTLAGGASAAVGAQPMLLAAPVELMIGVAMGLTMAAAFAAVDAGSRLLSIQMGLSLGAVFDPVVGEAATPLQPLFAVIAGLLFLALNLHLAVIRVLAESFTALPIGGALPSGLFGTLASLVAVALELAVKVAMPLALVLLLVELAVALISRAIPQVNVFFLGLPIKILLGIALIAVTLPGLLNGLAGLYSTVIDGTTAAIGATTAAPTAAPAASPAR
jgi:flagellar biosynthetic protein FliR